MELPEGTRIQLLAPLIRGRKGEYAKLFEEVAKEGFARVRVDGETKELREKIVLDKKRKHTIEVVVDRLVMKPDIRKRLTDSVETTLRLSTGIVTVLAEEPKKAARELTFSEAFACVYCGLSFEELAPRLFSFNSPYGACPACSGLGEKIEIDPWKVIPDRSKSIEDGAIAPWAKCLGSGRFPSMNPYYLQQLERVLKRYRAKMTTPIDELLGRSRRSHPLRNRSRADVRLYVAKRARRGNTRRRSKASSTTCSGATAKRRATTSRKTSRSSCRHRPARRARARGSNRKRWPSRSAVRTSTRDAMSIENCEKFFQELKLDRTPAANRASDRQRDPRAARISHQRRLELSHARRVPRRRSRAANRSAFGWPRRSAASLVGVLYILDEPSIGLHQRDNDRLLATLKTLRDLGNTLIVIEHDEDTMRKADVIVDIGPGAGAEGGYILTVGTLDEF